MTDVNDTLARAGALIGAELTEGADLGGSRRSLTLRAHRADGSSVIVKAYDPGQPYAASAFVREAAGLSFHSGGPELLGADGDALMTVMADLGDWPSLVDRLLAGDPAAATEGLLAWARAYGEMGRASLGREDELDALREKFAIDGDDDPALWDAPKLARLRGLLDGVGITTSAAFASEVDDLNVLSTIGPRVFSPGDICPDNNLLTGDGFRAIDFEGAGYRSAYLDAAYVTMPFATCWCVFALPAEVVAAVSDEYWTALLGRPARRGESEGVRLAVVHWTLDMLTWLMERAFAGDEPMGRGRAVVSSIRQVLRHRLDTVATMLDGLPAIAAVIEALRERTDGWPRIERYPAYTTDSYKPGT
ncbi:hypothetical protein Afil01_16910 [Actinorhabdospora filicis]|uniref:Aminoglycoside phosphotransferase domain-containing protein n=1 Tax=Actinorhabdospora filicis TaxID=1785913 RepID=A0A9W6SJR6_9ACTN|nr:hypothetical protein [Actinorhabdospora filicis]GLZ76884.1 hypothetical protein Afil01_16910 [Actinorhabdospora filicis]